RFLVYDVLTQNGEVMRNGGLGHIQFLDDLVDREGFAAADVHDLLAGFVRNGFGVTDVAIALQDLQRIRRKTRRGF
ncbi:MAG: hypothetical protein M1485_04270, partial [Chloroflexi bacterium]|nr:hypothetical protein [Chloroflexota bacterium]